METSQSVAYLSTKSQNSGIIKPGQGKRINLTDLSANQMDTFITVAGTFGGYMFLSGHPQNTSTQYIAGANTTAPTTTTTVPVHTTPSTIQQHMGHQPIFHPLNPVQEALLARDPNFAMVWKYPSRKTVEETYTRLPLREAGECRNQPHTKKLPHIQT